MDDVLNDSIKSQHVSQANPDNDNLGNIETNNPMDGTVNEASPDNTDEEASPDFETDSCVVIQKKKISIVCSSQEPESDSPSLLGRRKRKSERVDPESIYDKDRVTDEMKILPSKMLFTPFPTSPESKRLKQSYDKQTEIGLIVDVTQGKTQKSTPGNLVTIIKNETEITDSIQWDTQMLRDVETNADKKIETNIEIPNSSNNHIKNRFNSDTLMYLANEKSADKLTNHVYEKLPKDQAKAIGFKTARGNKVQKPSTISLTKAKMLFSDVEINDIEELIPVDGFKTASGKELKSPSKESLNEVKKMFSDVENETKMSLTNSKVSGFQTAAGNWLKSPSRDAINQAKHLLFDQSINSITDNDHKHLDFVDHSNNLSNAAFMKESVYGNHLPNTKIAGKTTECLDKSVSLTSSGSKMKTPSKESLIELDVNASETFGNGFTTAAGNKMKAPSYQSLKKAKNIFDDLQLSGIDMNAAQTTVHCPTATEQHGTIREDKAPSSSPPLRKIFPGSSENVSSGFKTASGKLKPLSGEYLKLAKNVFRNECLTTSYEKENVSFMSGAGKKLDHPSKKALNKAKQLFEEDFQTVNPQSLSEERNKKMNIFDSTLKIESKIGLGSVPGYPGSEEFKSRLSTSSKISANIQNKNQVNRKLKSCDDKMQECKLLQKNNLSHNILKVKSEENKTMRNGLSSIVSNKEITTCVKSAEEQLLTTLLKELNQLIVSGRERNKIKPLALQVARTKEKLTIKEKLKKEWKVSLSDKACDLGQLLKVKLNSKNGKSKVTLLEIGSNTPLASSPEMHLGNKYAADGNMLDSDKSFIQRYRFPIENSHRIDTSDIDKLIQSVYIPVGQDGATIICNNDGTVGITEITSSFIACPNIDPKLLSPTPEIWISNHYRWIFWKLLSLELKFPTVFSGNVFCPATIVDQLRLRYDREVERCERSALKLIYEGDCSPSQGIVLCVATIDNLTVDENNMGHDTICIELTDGWYSITSILSSDNPLTKYIEKKQIVVGTKLITYGAELLNMSQPCTPLEAPNYRNLVDECYALIKNNSNKNESSIIPPSSRTSSISDTLNKYPILKLSPNSTRRVKWDTKLGFYRHAPTMAISFSSLLNNGGFVSELLIEVVRQYPLVYKESSPSENNIDSTYRPVFINEKVYERNTTLKRIDKNKIIEEIYLEVQKEFECNEKQNKKNTYSNLATRKGISSKKTSRFPSEKEIKELCTGEEINDAVEESPDPSAVESLLSKDQCRVLQDYKQALKDKKESLMKLEIEKRVKHRLTKQESKDLSTLGANQNRYKDISNINYIPILRLRVVDLFSSPRHQVTKTFTGTIQLWRPTEEMISILKEGKRFRFFNLIANIVRDGEVQFRATKMTRFQELSKTKAVKPSKNAILDLPMDTKNRNMYEAIADSRYRRRLTHIDDIVVNSDFNPEFREVDIVGILVQVGPIKASSNQYKSPLSEQNSSYTKQSFITPNIQNPFETIYVCDTSINFIAIKFWKGMKEYGFENLITLDYNDVIKSPGGDVSTPATILYFQNLQWRAFSSQECIVNEENSSTISFPTLFVTEQTKITKNPSGKEPSTVFQEIQTEVGKGIEGIKFVEQAQLRLTNILSVGKVKNLRTPNSTFKSTIPTSPLHLIPHDDKTPRNTPTVTPHNIPNFKVPQQSPTTPLTSRSRNRTQIRTLNYEDQLIKGNVENVPGSPAELQSKKTSEKMRALEKASIKLSYWNP